MSIRTPGMCESIRMSAEPSPPSGEIPRRGSATARRTAERVEQLVDVAATLFARRGYHATSIQDVADTAGIRKGNVYYYVTTKEDLLYAIVRRHHDAALAEIESFVGIDSPVDRIIAFMRAYVRRYMIDPDAVKVFIYEFENLGDERRQAINAERRRYSEFLTEAIRDGQAEGTIRAELDAEAAALGMLGMLNWTFRWFHRDGRLSPETLVETYLDLAVSGLRTR
jgi:TetR/AcrR family transcriptional regulator, cholesterol catabolism regulator